MVKNNIINVLKGVFFALITSLACVFLYALILKIFALSGRGVKWVNQAIKILAILIGCLVAVKDSIPLVKGGAVGLLAGVGEYLIFGLISKNLNFGVKFLIDLLFGTLIGVIISCIVNFVRKK